VTLCTQAFRKNLRFAAIAALMAAGITSAHAQGVVDDWSTHHIKFNDPGSEVDAVSNGHHQEWKNYVNDPRYQMQQLRRSAVWANRFASAEASVSRGKSQWEFEDGKEDEIKRDWAVQIAGIADDAMALGTYPAVYSTVYSGSLASGNCSTDYAVFPVNQTGKITGTKQANLMVFNNLYKGLCTGTVPAVADAYYVGAGPISTSPVLSEDGTKVAFVVSIRNGATFNVLTLATGTGTAYNVPAAPGLGKITTISMHTSVSDTSSSPWIDYKNDIAYVGDDSGNVHKFTCVFTCTPLEVTTGGWPFAVAGSALTGPVYDSASGNIYVGGGTKIYCIAPAGGTGGKPAACPTAGSVVVATGTNLGDVNDPPVVVDSGATSGTTGWIFSNANNNNFFSSAAYVMQAPLSATGIGTATRLQVGQAGTTLHNGDFDNAYYNATGATPVNYSSGHLYYCGTATTGTAVSTLWQIAFNSGGTMTTATAGPALTTDSSDCSPLTEVYNGTTDFLFLGVSNKGTPTGCASDTCIMQFTLGSSFSNKSVPLAVSLGNPGFGNGGVSGIVIDNISTSSGASQIYFGNLVSGDATQLSQAALK
jgi:hypothetical protein